MSVEIKLKIKTPRVPNFVSIEMPEHARSEGFKELPSISIADLSEDQLNDIASNWCNDLHDMAETLRKNRANF